MESSTRRLLITRTSGFTVYTICRRIEVTLRETSDGMLGLNIGARALRWKRWSIHLACSLLRARMTYDYGWSSSWENFSQLIRPHARSTGRPTGKEAISLLNRPIPNGLIVHVTCRLFGKFGRPWPFSMLLVDLQPRMNLRFESYDSEMDNRAQRRSTKPDGNVWNRVSGK